MRLTYLASPYSDALAAVREARFHAVCKVAAELLRDGKMVFSPIAHSYSIAAWGLPDDWTFWREYDRLMLSRCDALLVLCLPGWQESVGVQEEIAIARELGKPVSYMIPEGMP